MIDKNNTEYIKKKAKISLSVSTIGLELIKAEILLDLFTLP